MEKQGKEFGDSGKYGILLTRKKSRDEWKRKFNQEKWFGLITGEDQH